MREERGKGGRRSGGVKEKGGDIENGKRRRR